MRLLLLFFLSLSFNCLAQIELDQNQPDVSPNSFLSQSQMKRRAVSRAQRALLQYPYMRENKRKYEKAIQGLIGKEVLTTVGTLHIILNSRQISTRQLGNLSLKTDLGVWRPDISYDMERGSNSHIGLFFNRSFP